MTTLTQINIYENTACNRARRVGYNGRCTECPHAQDNGSCLDTMGRKQFDKLLSELKPQKQEAEKTIVTENAGRDYLTFGQKLDIKRSVQEGLIRRDMNLTITTPGWTETKSVGRWLKEWF